MYCYDWEEYSVNKGKTEDYFNSKLYFTNYEEKWVLLKSSSTKRNDINTNQKKKNNNDLVGFKIW